MKRRTAGRLVGAGGFLFMVAVFLAPLRFGWPVIPVVAVALVMGAVSGAGLRAVVQSGWPRMPEALRDLDAPAADHGLDVLKPAPPQPLPVRTADPQERRTYRRDVDETVVTSVAEVFAERPNDLTAVIPRPKPEGYRGERRAVRR